MTEGVKFSGQALPAGQPVAAADVSQDTVQEIPQADEQQAAPEIGLTEAQLRKIIAEETARSFEQLRRQQQSSQAKAENRIKQEVQRQLETIRAAGLQPTTDQERAIETAVRNRVAQQDQSPEKPDAQSAQPEGISEMDPTDAAAYAMMESLGVELEDHDPEAGTLDRSSPKAYLASMHKALMRKQARLSSSPAARTPVGNGGQPANPILNIDDPTELFRMARKTITGR